MSRFAQGRNTFLKDAFFGKTDVSLIDCCQIIISLHKLGSRNLTKMTFKHIFSLANSYWNELTPIRYQFEEKADSFWLWFDSTFLWQVKVGRSGTFLFMFAELRSRNFFFTAEQHTSCCQFYRRQHQGQWCVPLTMEKTIGAL